MLQIIHEFLLNECLNEYPYKSCGLTDDMLTLVIEIDYHNRYIILNFKEDGLLNCSYESGLHSENKKFDMNDPKVFEYIKESIVSYIGGFEPPLKQDSK